MANGSRNKVDINIFLSHKHEDYDAAKVIRDNLETYAAGRIKFYVSEELPVGMDWYEWIVENLAVANWFMLLFTDPSMNWDWCLFEAGMFRARMGDEPRISRLICFHDPTVKIPEQLSKFQSVSAESDRMQEFLRQLFEKSVAEEITPINPMLVSNKKVFENLTKALCDAIMSKSRHERKEIDQVYFNKYLDLRIHSPDKELSDEEIQTAKLLKTKSDFDDIFLVKVMPETWGDLINTIKEEAQDEEKEDINLLWLDELHLAIKRARKGLSFNQPQAIVRGLKNKKLYHPILHHMTGIDEGPNSYRDFHLVFVLTTAAETHEAAE